VFGIGGNTFYDRRNKIPMKIQESKRSEIGIIAEFHGISKWISQPSCDVTRVVSLGTNNLSIRVCESGEKSCLLRLLNVYLLSRFSSNGFTLWILILSILFPH
jgi:hypothetical protein